MKMAKYSLISVAIFLAISCTKNDPDQPANDNNQNTSGTFKDPRDGQVYPTIKIGNQVWMKKNLNYPSSSGSWCIDCDTYGRFYTWQAAKTAAPQGWHLPSETEWAILRDYLGGYQIAGGKMKTTTGWIAPNLGADNSSGFSGLAAGWKDIDGKNPGVGYYAAFWSTNEDNYPVNGRHSIIDFSTSMCQLTTIAKEYGLSVRCIKD